MAVKQLFKSFTEVIIFDLLGAEIQVVKIGYSSKTKYQILLIGSLFSDTEYYDKIKNI